MHEVPERNTDDGEPPFFRTWGRLYAAIVAWGAVCVGLARLFSRWAF